MLRPKPDPVDFVEESIEYFVEFVQGFQRRCLKSRCASVHSAGSWKWLVVPLRHRFDGVVQDHHEDLLHLVRINTNLGNVILRKSSSEHLGFGTRCSA
jgi:hypothetical protein